MDLENSLSSLNDLSRYVTNNRLFEIVIHTENAGVNVAYDDIAPLIAKANEIFSGLDAGAIAFVAANDMLFAQCRQLQLQLESEKVPVCVFREEQPAIEWIKNTMNVFNAG